MMSNKRDFLDEITIKEERFKRDNEVCRLCANQSSEYSSIFLENLHESLNLHLGLTILETDNWPKIICAQCLITARTCLNFVTNIRTTENKLRDLYGDFQIEEQKPEFEAISVPDITLKVEAESSSDPLDQKKENLSKKSTRRSSRKSKTKPEVPQCKTPKLEAEIKDEDVNTVDTEVRQSIGTKPSKRKTQEKIRKIEEFYTTLTCENCQKIFSKYPDFMHHYRTEHNQEGYIFCCNLRLKRPALIIEHINYHQNPEFFKCAQCKKCFKTNQGLKGHKALYHSQNDDDGDHQFRCPKCPKIFRSTKELRKHGRVHKPKVNEELPCTQCNKTFAYKKNLQVHIRQIHDQVVCHVCEICAKTFKQKDNFLRHQRIHSGKNIPNEPCPTCGKLLMDKYQLKKHMKLHSESGKVFRCHICSKDTVSSGALRCHIRRVHIIERKHKCKMCEAAFKTPLALKEHTASHSSTQILYTCSYCPKQFNSNANMYVHQKRKHPEEHAAAKMK